MNAMRKIAFLLFGLLVGWSAQAQKLDKKKLDAYFNQLSKYDKFMGNVAMSRGGKVIYSNSIGFADIKKKQKNQQKTPFRIGSISKTFTAVLVLKAVEDSLLQLEQRLSDFFPTVPNAELITLRMLLNHRSGIHNFTNDPSFLGWLNKKKSREEMLEIIIEGGSDFMPDSITSYSNANYVLLSYILEDRYQKSFLEILDAHIVLPLGLKQTGFGDRTQSKRPKASSYAYYGDWKLETETDPSIPMGAGAIISTPSDLVVFAEALFNNKLLKPETLAKMLEAPHGMMGLGIFRIPFNDQFAYGHTGGIDGFVSVFGYFPDEKLAFAITSNAVNMDFNEVTITLLKAAFQMDFEIPTYEGKELSPEEIKMYEGVYSSSEFPLKITVKGKNGTLMAQATGQSEFPLDAYENHVFRFDRAGIVMRFNPEEQTLTLEQGGGKFVFKKE